MSNALPEPDRSCPTRTAIPLLFPIGRVPFFSGLLGLVPCASAFPRSGVRSHRTLGVRSHRTLGVLQSTSLRPPNPLCSPSRPARRTSRNTSPQRNWQKQWEEISHPHLQCKLRTLRQWEISAHTLRNHKSGLRSLELHSSRSCNDPGNGR